MSEELHQRNLLKKPQMIGDWAFYNIGATTIKSLRDHKIIKHKSYKGLLRKKVDALITDNQRVVAIVEYKAPSKFRTQLQKKKAIEQELAVAKELTKVLIVTDTTETIWINALNGELIQGFDGKPITVIFDPESDEVVDILNSINDSINEQNSQLIPPRLIDPTPLSKQIWQDIWAVSGATPENCLYTFVELFIFKYLSDLKILEGMYSFNHLMELYKKHSDEDVLEYYAGTVRKYIKDKFKQSEIDGTTIINGTIFVSSDEKAISGYGTVFRKILKRFSDEGELKNIHHDFKSKLFESFLKESISKKNWGQFFTPLKVVRSIVEMVDIRDGMTICDPACGVGKFLLEPVLENLSDFYEVKRNKIHPKIKLEGFDKGFDRDEQKTIILAKANMLIYFSDLVKKNPTITDSFSKLFNETFVLKTNSILGTLSDDVRNKYDLILTNPPYVMSGSSNLKEEVKRSGLEDYYSVNASGVEGLFMEWIVNALKPGGIGIVVVPDGILNRQHDKQLRDFILRECYVDAIISLPLNTFFTTNKKTYILAITKKINASKAQEHPLFSYLVSEIGETRDINRFEIDENHLQDGVNLYNQFKGAKKKFKSSDKRFKSIPFKTFESNTHWQVDKYWSEDERIELGLIERNNSITLDEFSLLLGDLSDSFLEFQEQLNDLAGKKKSELTFKNYKIKELFTGVLGDPKLTKKYGNNHKGKYPVFSASSNGPLTHINKYDYDGDYLTWARNGFAGYMSLNSGKFSINYDRGILIPKNDKINPRYVKFVLEPILRDIATGRKGQSGSDEFTKVYLSMIEEVSIPVPIDSNDEISAPLQEELYNDYQVLFDIRKDLESNQGTLKSVQLSPNFDFDLSVGMKVKDLFDIKKGKSIYTKKFIRKNPGRYPLYSSQTTEDGAIGYIKSFDHDEKCLTWTTDGIHAGTVFIRDGKFSMTTHCGALIPKEGYRNKISLEYLYHYLNNFLKKEAYGEQNKRVTVNTVSDFEIILPLDNSGQVCLNTQRKIAKQLNSAYLVKKNTVEQVSNIISSNVIP